MTVLRHPVSKLKQKPKHWEDDEQALFMEWMHAQYRREYQHCFHVPNGGKRNAREAARLKRQGVKKGIPDIFIDLPKVDPSGRVWYGFRSEFKATPPNDAAVSTDQKECLSRMSGAGYYAVLCKGFNDLKQRVSEYLSWEDAPACLRLPTK